MLGKDNKKGIKEWAKNLKHNEEFAKKYEGLTTVEGILATARKDGYDIKKEELMAFDLDSVAGGAGANGAGDVNAKTKINVETITSKLNASATGTNSSASNSFNFNYNKS